MEFPCISIALLLLQKLEVDEVARRLEIELPGKDVDAIVKAVKKKINKKVKTRHGLSCLTRTFS